MSIAGKCFSKAELLEGAAMSALLGNFLALYAGDLLRLAGLAIHQKYKPIGDWELFAREAFQKTIWTCC